jgi:hypothetical protein
MISTFPLAKTPENPEASFRRSPFQSRPLLTQNLMAEADR